MQTQVLTFSQMIQDGAKLPANWEVRAVVNDDNFTYLAYNTQSREALWVDPMKDDWETLLAESRKLEGYRFLAVIDTHTHADHISCAAELADAIHAPLVMHEGAPSRKIHLRISRDVKLPSAAAPLEILITPGHTRDSITPIWGPFLFGGDTLMYGDTGRDDLPGGDPEAHYESLQKIKARATAEMVMLPGHDGSGGRVSTWKTQLEVSPSLTQSRETFIAEAGSYVGPSPKLLKESLFYNFQ
jgi:sulfur dioxygenase